MVARLVKRDQRICGRRDIIVGPNPDSDEEHD